MARQVVLKEDLWIMEDRINKQFLGVHEHIDKKYDELRKLIEEKKS